MFRRSNSKVLLFLQRETTSKQKQKNWNFFFMNIEIVTNFGEVKLG